MQHSGNYSTAINLYSKAVILHCSPYRTDKNLGVAYNEIMRLLKPGDSACFQDGDSCHLLPDYGTIIEKYHETYPGAVLTARTNRIHHLSKQLDNGIMDEKCDIRELLMKAYSRKHLTTVTEIKPGEGMSGVLMVVPYNVWQRVPFRETGKALGVDSAFRQDLHAAGIKILIMDALLIFHVYRLLNGNDYKNHLL